jgi:hypothetical protein
MPWPLYPWGKSSQLPIGYEAGGGGGGAESVWVWRRKKSLPFTCQESNFGCPVHGILFKCHTRTLMCATNSASLLPPLFRDSNKIRGGCHGWELNQSASVSLHSLSENVFFVVLQVQWHFIVFKSGRLKIHISLFCTVKLGIWFLRWLIYFRGKTWREHLEDMVPVVGSCEHSNEPSGYIKFR